MCGTHLKIAIGALNTWVSEIVVYSPALAPGAKTHAEVGMLTGLVAAVEGKCLVVGVFLNFVQVQVSVAVDIKTIYLIASPRSEFFHHKSDGGFQAAVAKLDGVVATARQQDGCLEFVLPRLDGHWPSRPPLDVFLVC